MLPFSRARASRLQPPIRSSLAGLVHVPWGSPPDPSKSGWGSSIPAPRYLLRGSLHFDRFTGLLSCPEDPSFAGRGCLNRGSNLPEPCYQADPIYLPGLPGNLHQRGQGLSRLVHEFGGR